MSDGIRTPPHNDDAERAVLGAILVDNEAVNIARQHIDPTDFYRERHRHIYRAMLACDEGGQPIDVVTLCDQLVESGHFDAVGGQSSVARLANEVPSASNIQSHIDIVARNAKYRDAVSTLGSFVEQAYDPSDDFGDFAADVSHAVDSIVSEADDDNMQTAAEVAEDCVEQAETWNDDDSDAGVSTGIEAIDHYWKLEPSRLYVVAGRPGMGKSALIQQMQGDLSMDRGLRTAYFSLEMSNAQVGFRHLCQNAQVDQERIRRGTLGEPGWRSLIEAAGKFQPAPMHFDDTERISLAKLRAKVKRLTAQYDLRCVFVDYLQMMNWRKEAQSKTEGIGALAYGLKGLAKDCDIPVVAAAQLNRGVEDRQNKEPRVRDLRASGMIEEAADVIGMLYRENFYDDDSEGEGLAKLLTRKNRSGKVGKAEMWWTPEHTLFRDIDRHHRGRSH